MELTAIAQATLGAGFLGLFPVLVWLAFWLFEDWRHPEPRVRLITAFVTGMLTVAVVLPFQSAVSALLPFQFASDSSILLFALLLTWALIEEVAKFGLAWFLVLRNRAVDEPIDMAVYMITVALGFAAVENTLFLIAPFMGGEILEGALTANLRFVGATLIHTLGSAIVGIALGMAFFRPLSVRRTYILMALILATSLHALFNFLIITTAAGTVLTIFLAVWVGVIAVLLMFERIKMLRPPSWWEKMTMGSNLPIN